MCSIPKSQPSEILYVQWLHWDDGEEGKVGGIGCPHFFSKPQKSTRVDQYIPYDLSYMYIGGTCTDL